MYIANQKSLEKFVSQSQGTNVLAIDTEFMREKTYYARLCLLQMATDTETVVIDPFRITNLKVLNELLESPNIIKLFHAGRQDIEILFRETGVIPQPIFDTQVAAALLGHTQQIGYASLVQAECSVQLKKIESFTDWSRRPLSDSQIKYAKEDVVYLPQIYEKMKTALETKGRMQWLDQDFKKLTDENQYTIDAKDRFRRLKRVSQLSRRQLSAAREFAYWRELEAQRRDIPRKWVLTDEQIVEACKREARTLDSLFMVRGMREKLSTEQARNALAVIEKGLDKPKEEWPDTERGSKSEQNVDIELDLMNALVRLRAKENEVAFQTLASHDDLQRLARGYTKDVSVLAGWRYHLVGKELLSLLAGDITLSLDKGRLRVTDISH